MLLTIHLKQGMGGISGGICAYGWHKIWPSISSSFGYKLLLHTFLLETQSAYLYCNQEVSRDAGLWIPLIPSHYVPFKGYVHTSARYVALTVEIVKNVGFCSVTLCSLIQTYGRCVRPCSLVNLITISGKSAASLLSETCRKQVTPEAWYASTNFQGVLS